MFKCKPERNKKSAFLTVAISIIVCSACFISSVLVPQYGGMIQTAGLVLLTAAIFAVYRYVLTEMEYTLTETEFGAAKCWANRRQDICCLDLDTAVEVCDKQTYKSKYKSKVNIRYNCNQNIGAQSWFYVCEFNGRLASIEFEPNAVFLKIMQDAVAKAIANRSADTQD